MSLTILALRNVFREKVRAVLTLLGIAVAMMTLLVLGTALRSWDAAQDVARKDRLVTRHKVTFIMTLPKRYVDEIREAKRPDGSPLASKVTWSSWFGGRVPGREREFFASYAIDPESYFDVMDEIEVSPEALETLRNDRGSAIIGDLLARDFGWKPGDTITLDSPIYPSADGAPWTFTVAGVYTTKSRVMNRQTLVFPWARLNEVLPPHERDTVGWITSTTPGENAADAALAIDRFFDDREVQTLSQDERAFATSFLGMVSSVLDVVAVLSGVIVLIMAMILANTIAMAVNERSGELASLKAIGFGPRSVAYVVVVEAAFFAVVGSLLGLVAGVSAIDGGLGAFFEEKLTNLFPVFRVEPGLAALALAVSVAASLAAACIPAWVASRLQVTEALRRTL